MEKKINFENNIKFNLDITMSKIAAITIVVMSPIFLTGGMIISGWIIAAGLLGWKQGADAIKKIKGNDSIK